jgi:hypothetical protein
MSEELHWEIPEGVLSKSQTKRLRKKRAKNPALSKNEREELETYTEKFGYTNPWPKQTSKEVPKCGSDDINP